MGNLWSLESPPEAQDKSPAPLLDLSGGKFHFVFSSELGSNGSQSIPVRLGTFGPSERLSYCKLLEHGRQGMGEDAALLPSRGREQYRIIYYDGIGAFH